MQAEILVIKRDGGQEPFDPEKITKVTAAAGLRPIDAAEVAERVAGWVEKRGKKEVSSIQIRDRVFKELEKVDRYASGLFAWYQNLKDKSYKSN
jgi:transcriptional regulator NrdR family protein